MDLERGDRMNKQELLESIENMGSEVSENYPHDQVVDRELVIKLVEGLDEPEKVVVPKWFDEWVKGNVSHSHYHGKILMIKNISKVGWSHTFETGMSGEVYKPDSVGILSIYHSEVYNYQEKYIRAVLDGYEIEKEKEKLYYIELIKGKRCMAQVADGTCWFPYGRKDVLSGVDKIEFTESEIKAIDERFWPFAVEVSE